MKMWWFIGEDMVVHQWRRGGSLVEMWPWWLIDRDVVTQQWTCGGSLEKMLWLIDGYVLAHLGDAVAHQASEAVIRV